jgi:uncharacterized membrane protein
MWKELFNEHKGAAIGLMIGIFLGLIYLIVGFWKTLVFCLIALVCVWVGHRIDRQESWMNLEPLSKWLSERWRMFR